MKDIEAEKNYMITRAEFFIKALKNAKHPFEIEGQVYALMATAKNAFHLIHEINSKEIHPPSDKRIPSRRRGV